MTIGRTRVWFPTVRSDSWSKHDGAMRTHNVHMSIYIIRAATDADRDTLVAFTMAEAREAERAMLDAVKVRQAIAAAFATPPRARYWVAETEREIIASTSIVTEWSDFHAGEYWWVQSLYIVPAHRGSGLLEQLLDHLTLQAQTAGALDVRLYVHTTNTRAVRAYQRCGFSEAPYLIMRRGWK
jgi:ribosomal protein S18 acetylase RimI-like enzyme